MRKFIQFYLRKIFYIYKLQKGKTKGGNLLYGITEQMNCNDKIVAPLEYRRKKRK